MPFDEGTYSYKLGIKFFEQTITIPIFEKMTSNKAAMSKNEVELNLAKVFYFFTNETSNLKQILKNEIVRYILTFRLISESLSMMTGILLWLNVKQLV